MMIFVLDVLKECVFVKEYDKDVVIIKEELIEFLDIMM